MRILSGSARGRELKTAKGEGFRPAMAKTREALFSMLEARGVSWPDLIVLDLFAGCGSLGYECLSRGAKRAWLVDNGAPAFACLEHNSQALDLAGDCQLLKRDALRFLRGTPPAAFNLVFIDPPYRRDLVSKSLALLAKGAWLAKDAFIVAEAEKDKTISAPETFQPAIERVFGQTCIHVWMYS